MDSEHSGTAGSRMKDLPNDDLPREKLAKLGAGSLSDAEILAIFLRTGLPGENVLVIARKLLRHFGTLGALGRARLGDLTAIRGVGRVKALHLMAAFDLGRRVASEKFQTHKMDTPEDIFELLGQEMQLLEREEVRVVLLDTKLSLKKAVTVSSGTLNESIAHPRDILRAAVEANAYGFVLVHNHPTGDPRPSRADHALTRRIVDAGEIVRIPMLDHIIIGRTVDGARPFFSFKEHGHL